MFPINEGVSNINKHPVVFRLNNRIGYHYCSDRLRYTPSPYVPANQQVVSFSGNFPRSQCKFPIQSTVHVDHGVSRAVVAKLFFIFV